MSTIFSQAPHPCTNIEETFPPKQSKEGCMRRLKRHWFSLILISPKNPLTLEYFSTECQIKNERKRHYYSSNYFVIHPLSKLATFYEACLCVFYFITIFYKLIEVAFFRKHLIGTQKYGEVVWFLNILDITSWLNLIFKCFIGVVLPKQKTMLIDFKKIIWHRLRSFYFWAELLSSVPKCIICANGESCTMAFWLFLTGLRLFVICLWQQPIVLLTRTLAYIKIKSRPVLIILNLSYLLTFVTHVMACTAFAISRYRHSLVSEHDSNTWILYNDLINRDLEIQYCYAFFRASAQTFGVKIDEFQDTGNWEESILSLVNYALGKIINAIMWVTLIHVLLAKNLQDTRFQEIITQLNTWMENKELSKSLQKRVIDYYTFYFRKRFFSKKQIKKDLPESLKAKMKVNMYNVLKESNIVLFNNMSNAEIQLISEHFITEVYSPRDVIIYAGTKGDSLYVLASGSVAVYSHSGKEVCHLYDGAYFGEMDILLKDQKVMATIVALETSKIYRIRRKYFEKFVLSRQDLHDMFMKQAEMRLQQIKEAEKAHRRDLFAEKYKK